MESLLDINVVASLSMSTKDMLKSPFAKLPLGGTSFFAVVQLFELGQLKTTFETNLIPPFALV